MKIKTIIESNGLVFTFKELNRDVYSVHIDSLADVRSTTVSTAVDPYSFVLGYTTAQTFDKA